MNDGESIAGKVYKGSSWGRWIIQQVEQPGRVRSVRSGDMQGVRDPGQSLGYVW